MSLNNSYDLTTPLKNVKNFVLKSNDTERKNLVQLEKNLDCIIFQFKLEKHR